MKASIYNNPTKLAGIILTIVMVGALSIIALAQTIIPSLKIEAESGSALSGASIVGDATASGGNHLAFASTPPSTNSFFEDFTGDMDLSGFNSGVWHRDPHLVDQTQWPGDHESHAAGDCGGPTTSRTVHRNAPVESIYLCQSVDGDPAKAHIMTSVGDTSGYSIGWFSPKKTFSTVNSVKFNVNLTDLGARQWWKVGVVSESQYNSTIRSGYDGQVTPGFLASDVGAATLPTSLATSAL